MAKEYLKHSILAKTDASYFINKIKGIIVWKNNCNILDVGCGPGNVTHDFLLPVLPKSANSVIAIDKLSEAIEYANTQYGQESKIIFKQIDIVDGVEWLANHEEYFDHIFSFYCLYLIQDQEMAFKNIYKMLKPGGDFFFTSCAQFNLFYAFDKILLNDANWATHIDSYKTSPFQCKDNPKKEIEKLVSKCGFSVSFITSESRQMRFPTHSIAETVFSLCLPNIPLELKSKFEVDLLEAIRSLHFTRLENNVEECCAEYDVIFAHLFKPM